MDRYSGRSDMSTALNPNKLYVYLQHVSGQVDLLHPIILDHPYAKPKNWKLDNTYAKPLTTLFVTRKSLISSGDNYCQIQDASDSERPKPPYDDAKAKADMLETEHILSSVLNPENDDPDWESRLNRTGWNTLQAKIFDRAMRILNHDRLARLTQENSWNEPALRRVTVNKSARRFRTLLSTFGWKMPLLQWLHNTFMENLDIPHLVSYINILQVLKKKVPALAERMLSTVSYNSRIPHEAMTMLFKKPADPGSSILSCFNPNRLPGNPILLIVPSAPGSNTAQNPRVQRWFHNLSLIGHVSTVTTNNLKSTKATMTTVLDHMLAATRSKLSELRADHVGRTVVLVGFNSGAALALQVALLEQTVTAVICMGFPLNTVEDKRGQPDDNILNLTVPVLFVHGQHATSASVDDLEDLRERLRVESGLVVVGSADDQLRVIKSKLAREGITQTMVDRCIVDEIADFVGTILLTPPVQQPSSAVNSTIIVRSENRPKIKFLEKKRKYSGGDDTSPSPRKNQMLSTPQKRVGRPSNRGTGRHKWTASNDVPIPRRFSEGTAGLNPRQSMESLVSYDLTCEETTTLTSEDNLIDKLTPDSLMDMPVIIAPDETPSEPAPVKMTIKPPSRRGLGRPPGNKRAKNSMKIVVGKEALHVKKTIKTMSLKDVCPSRLNQQHFARLQNVDDSPDV